MKNIKDIEKTDINSYGHASASGFKTLFNKDISDKGEYIHKKTEKIVTAIYMVTDYIEDGEALKAKLRSTSLDLLSDVYAIASPLPVDKNNTALIIIGHTYELISLTAIADTVGLISEMNTGILKRELSNLVREIKEFYPENKHFAFSLDEKMFTIESLFNKGQLKDKRTTEMLTPPSISSVGVYGSSDKTSTVSKEITKNQRIESILAFLKDKKADVSIRDISQSIPDRSEKTIQRELNSLVATGQIKKIGAKRWSRYQAL